MKLDFTDTKIYIRPGATDLRKGVTGLLYIIRDQMKCKPLTPSVFVFCNRSCTLLKMVWWDRTGFFTAQKRLEEEKWPWPKDTGEAMELNQEEVSMLLRGIDFWKAHKDLSCTDID